MADSNFLRKNKNQHAIKNSLSKKMDSDIDFAVQNVLFNLKKKFPELIFEIKKKLLLSEIISGLSVQFSEYQEFAEVLDSSFIKPDGGFVYATDQNGKRKLILVSEVKRQGTNDKRLTEGLPRQAKGNAIERLGKNLIGIRAIFKKEPIIPFICFGSGDDFKEGSTIRDRVITMNDFFCLNKIYLQKDHLPFEPVSMFFRYDTWSAAEMAEKMLEVAELAVNYYFRLGSISPKPKEVPSL